MDRVAQDVQCELLAKKKAILTGKDVDLPSGLEHLRSEWLRSKALLIDQKAESLGNEDRDLQVFDKLNARHNMHLDYLKDYYDAKCRFFGDVNAAFFHLQSDSTIYFKGGDNALLEELKARGIRLGTVLNEEHIGVSAVSVARDNPYQTIVRIGAENYLQLFEDYVCFARFCLRTAPRFSSLIFSVIPLSVFSSVKHQAILYALEVEDLSFKNLFLYPSLEKKMNLIEKSAYIGPNPYILVDAEKNVVFSDQSFERYFDIAIDSLNGTPLSEAFPELLPLLSFFKSKRNAAHESVTREVIMITRQGEQRFFRADCQQVSDEGQLLGFKITITSLQDKTTSQNRNAVFKFGDLIGSSPEFLRIKQAAQNAASSLSNVLITGESGTGKELFAQAIHNSSDRKNGPFVPVNCGAIPKELIGSELFGYEGGAFTGARKEGNPGKFELADHGTLFLDEIAEMPWDAQSYLLRFLEDRVLTRIGGKRSLNLDIRIIAATNKNLWDFVQLGTFRNDLFFRLNVLHFRLPALQERIDDIDVLVEHFLGNLSTRMNKSVFSASPETIALFKRYSWPGNLRELRNVLERCLNFTKGSILTLDDIPSDIITSFNAPNGKSATLNYTVEPSANEKPYQYESKNFQTVSWGKAASDNETRAFHAGSVDELLEYSDLEMKKIRQLMIECRGNKSLVAKRMGMSRNTLYRRLAQMRASQS